MLVYGSMRKGGVDVLFFFFLITAAFSQIGFMA